jgi:hypothetical protein
MDFGGPLEGVAQKLMYIKTHNMYYRIGNTEHNTEYRMHNKDFRIHNTTYRTQKLMYIKLSMSLGLLPLPAWLLVA